MITKKRLEELIEQGATIYHLVGKRNIEKTNAKYIPTHYLKNNFEYWELFKEYYFETEEDARWELEMTATRTETLKLPKWEEFLKDNFGIKFYYKSREFHLHKVRNSADDKNPEWKINLYESYCNDDDAVAWEKEWDLTKENYIEACKLCLRLFKNGEIDG